MLRKHQFLTLYHRFLEIFYNFLETHHSTVNELWCDITLADTSTKWIIWQFVNDKTFILGSKRQFLKLLHRFLEVFRNFLVTHYSTVNDLWFDITLADTSTNSIILQLVNNKTFLLGRKLQFFTLFHRILTIFLLLSCNTPFNCERVMIRHHISWNIKKWTIWQFGY